MNWWNRLSFYKLRGHGILSVENLLPFYTIFKNPSSHFNCLIASAMPPNGMAVEGVCVTGAAGRILIPVVGSELSRWQAGIACPDLSGAQYLRSRCARVLSRSRYKQLVDR